MKYCPKCGAENKDQSRFCEECGHAFESSENSPKRNQGANLKNNSEPLNQTSNPKGGFPKWLMVLVGVAVVAVVVGVGLALAGGSNDEATTPSSTGVTLNSTSTSNKIDTSKYDKLIAEAKELTINGEYKKSNLKLSQISASDLGRSEFASIADEVDELQAKNDDGMKQTDQTTDSSQKASDSVKSSSGSAFNGDYAKWANTYYFYYSQSSQKQGSLTIGANGSVTQKNVDGTQYFGQATITSASGDVLSYETNDQYPMDMPDTKMINPNVRITVTWDAGSTQTYYGYVSYSSRLALTDGVTKNAGVNEVWIS
ncbi:zinc ribbon domain-containing protein [Enterococcus hailinensis]|uniref:zinc ribbon domain-containing protein n=1 Tax=Enterococcus hailinensis TaxID=3238988 RepID=UPI0038B41472